MAVFAATVFLSAFLLFQVQPVIGKYIVPHFGGSASVWTTCMLFFQAMLLGGYAYAHLLASRLRNGQQVVVHVALLAACALFLPISPAADRWASSGDSPTTAILLMLVVRIGVPYLALSATGPLLQSWFARSNPGSSPYRLYALSNLGSLLGLLTYPLLFEPQLGLATQGVLWTIGFAAFAILSIVCGTAVARAAQPALRDFAETDREQPAPAALQITIWVVLAALGSVMLIAATNRMCQDLAAMPLLWVLPLSIYLITFIICFERDRWYDRRVFVPLFAIAVVSVAVVVHIQESRSIWALVGLHAFIVFAACMLAHGEIARSRPAARHLTLFYLAIAFGGALGGVLVAIGAPALLDDYWEYEIGLIALTVFGAAAILHEQRHRLTPRLRAAWAIGGMATFVVLTSGLVFRARTKSKSYVASSRSFYGVLHVIHQSDIFKRPVHILQHGQTTHGMQFRGDEMRRAPTSYYGRESGVGAAIHELRERKKRLRIGIIGLGTGTLAAYGEPGDAIRYYEIDPDIERTAKTHFSFLQDSKADVVGAEIGDARIVLQRELAAGQGQAFDLLAVDAFSSDAIPIHLLTHEAFAVYEAHMAADGVVAFHISNRHIDLRPVIRGLAARAGYEVATINWASGIARTGTSGNVWMLVTKNAAFFDAEELSLLREPNGEEATDVVDWTDDYASLLQVLRIDGIPPGYWQSAPTAGMFVIDSADVISPTDETRIRLILRRLYADTDGNYPLVIAAMPDIPDGFAGLFVDYRKAIYADSGLNVHRGRYSGLLIASATRERQIGVQANGKFWSDSQIEELKALLQQTVMKGFQDNDPSSGFVRAAEAYDRYLRADQRRRSGIGG